MLSGMFLSASALWWVAINRLLILKTLIDILPEPIGATAQCSFVQRQVVNVPFRVVKMHYLGMSEVESIFKSLVPSLHIEIVIPDEPKTTTIATNTVPSDAEREWPWSCFDHSRNMEINLCLPMEVYIINITIGPPGEPQTTRNWQYAFDERWRYHKQRVDKTLMTRTVSAIFESQIDPDGDSSRQVCCLTAMGKRMGISCGSQSTKRMLPRRRAWKTLGCGASDIGRTTSQQVESHF